MQTVLSQMFLPYKGYSSADTFGSLSYYQMVLTDEKEINTMFNEDLILEFVIAILLSGIDEPNQSNLSNPQK